MCKKWRCASYTRLSHEDRGGEVSNSIVNQQALLRSYIDAHPDLQLVGEWADDGASGVDFARAGFQQMMVCITSCEIDCIVVKDLSRFGRNYIEVGAYLERIFPSMGVRFLAVQDNYDSLHSKNGVEEILIPFKNLVNDAYLRDISVKIRSQLEIKRKKGEFVGAFAPYGYQKSPHDHNQLVIDPYAACIVRQIFVCKVHGYNNQEIAARLNQHAEPAPTIYKRSNGAQYHTPFQLEAHTTWTAQTVGRILGNAVYRGTLEQGKTTTANHKVKKSCAIPQQKWICVAQAHEAIIEQNLFAMVQDLLEKDTRKCQNRATMLFSGLLTCGDCKSALVRKIIQQNGVKYAYYVCAGHKKYRNCSMHSTAEATLEGVMEMVFKPFLWCSAQPQIVCDGQGYCEALQLQLAMQKSLYERLIQQKSILEEYVNKNTISKEQGMRYQAMLEVRLQACSHFIEHLQKKVTIKSEIEYNTTYLRNLMLALVQEIQILQDGQLRIVMRCANPFACAERTV